uniref:Protein kinase domain-containing protein n=1 Tax=Tetradesmus obliquus TaxID=3088 RepID=A0A383VY31_TETOB
MAKSIPPCDVVEELPLVSLEDKAHVQRATTNCIVPVRTLGTGAFGQVDLVSIPVAGERKLLVRKMLVPGSSRSSLDGNATATTAQAAVHKAPAALKPSSLQDWNNETTMHRECAGCPFVLQLLAAKRCRSGNMLLLLEYAALGSLTDILAARRQQRQQLLQQGDGSTDSAAAAAAGSNSSSSIMADTLMPLAMSAVELINRHAAEDDAKAAARSASVVDLTQYCEQQQQQQDEGSEAGDDAGGSSEESPVFVALMPELIAEAQQAAHQQFQQQQQQQQPLDAAAQADAAALQPAAADAEDLQEAAAQLCADGPPAEPCRVPHAGLPEEAARFFAGCVLMALQWMHSRRILHRDIKPCNLLLFDDGYLKLADMGCCCQLPPGIDAAQTRTGTAAYMAPEVASGGTPYSYPVDMWSLGITVWQMVDGHLPAWAEEQQQGQQGGGQAAEGQAEQQQQQQQQQYYEHPEPPEPLLYPAHFSKALTDLLSGLLHHDSAARMRIEDVMAASWFDGFDWQGLRDKTLAPPALEMLAPPPQV